MNWRLYKESLDSKYKLYTDGMFNDDISFGYYKVVKGLSLGRIRFSKDDTLKITDRNYDMMFLHNVDSKEKTVAEASDIRDAIEGGFITRVQVKPLVKSFYEGKLPEMLESALPNDVESFSFVVDDGWIVGINFKVVGKAYGDGRDVDYEGYDDVAIHLRGIDKFIYTLCEKCSNVMLQKELVTAAGYYD